MSPLPEITWQDVLQTPDDGNRYEAIEGELYVTPAPSVRHQRISKRLQLALIRLLEEPGHGEMLNAPVGVEFPVTGEGVQPDLLFVSNERRGDRGRGLAPGRATSGSPTGCPCASARRSRARSTSRRPSAATDQP